MNAHLKRWITSIVAIPVLIWIIIEGGAIFAVVIATASILAEAEYFKISGLELKTPFAITAFLSCPFIILCAYIKSFNLIIALLVVNLMAACIFALPMFGLESEKTIRKIGVQILGLIYIPVMLSFIVIMRQKQDGDLWIFLMLVSVFASDIGAFYGGRTFGSRKLCPSVSPGKTVEGGILGAASCIIACTIFRYIFFPSLPFWSYLLFISAAIAAPIGDLFESMLKRAGKIKDSGNILPGHGGLLDRIDSLLFAAPVFYIFSEIIL